MLIAGLQSGVARLALVIMALGGCSAAPSGVALSIAEAREGERVLASMDDLETARVAAIARLQRLEELVRLAPEQPAVRAMLVVGWARYALLFVEDDLEEARERGDSGGANYHAIRARNAYERAIHHGREYLGAGFGAAVDTDAVGAYLKGRQGDEPAALLWMGAAWLGRLRVTTENHKQLQAQSHVGEALLARSLVLDPQGQGGWAQALLGLWWGRAGGDLERARPSLEQAAEVSGRKLLMVQVFEARTVVCQAHDRERWDALFKGILDARDPAPEVRVDNAVAKRKATRDAQGTRRAQCVP